MSIPLCVGIIGFIIAAASDNIGARFFAMFIMASSYAGYVIILSWISNSIPRPSYKRAVALAITNCVSNTGNIAGKSSLRSIIHTTRKANPTQPLEIVSFYHTRTGSYIYPDKWAPSYWQSFTISACCFLVTVMLGAYHKYHLIQLNKELDRTRGDPSAGQQKVGSGAQDEEQPETAEQRILRAHQEFRYLV